MITSLKAVTKSAGLIAWPPNTKANANHIPVLPTSTHPNFTGSNKQKKRRQSCKRNSGCIRCHSTPEKGMVQGSMYRRQLLVASTSLPFKPQQMMAAMSPPPNFTDYHKLANAVQKAEKFKNSPHSSTEINDGFCWLSSPKPLNPPNSKSPDELSGLAAVPPAQEVHHKISEKEVVTARVRRPAALKDKEEELVLEGIEVTNEKPLCFHVYIKLGQEDDDEEEGLYVGTFSHMPPRSKQGGHHNNKEEFDGREEQNRARTCCLRLGMNDMLSHRPESVIVKLVPTLKLADDPIKVASIFLDST